MKNLILEFTNELPPQEGENYTVLVHPPHELPYFETADYQDGTWHPFERKRWLEIRHVIAWARHPSDEVLAEWLRVNFER